MASTAQAASLKGIDEVLDTSLSVLDVIHQIKDELEPSVVLVSTLLHHLQKVKPGFVQAGMNLLKIGPAQRTS